ncbi:MAG: AAA domain-containing protein, partial [Pseudomonadota bacterium]|nr:AAA domain-containing protein [Pseudomonadota bacterium]
IVRWIADQIQQQMVAATEQGIDQQAMEQSLAGQSIGVVTFSQPQQRLIEDLLDKLFVEQPALEQWAKAGLEPLFVKNLENVQGDERDIVIFSVTYAPDALGRLSMNFGPLNRQGGQRRLNVAITRARQALHVFATLRPEQIDLSRTSSQGVRDLKDFLSFAQHGASALARAVSSEQGATESPFEDYVYNALSSRGWDVHTQVGCAGYRIDLAVVDPQQVGRYLLAIECDGATYHRAATARDRDQLRQQVLEGLGWTVERIWSTDWWHDPIAEINRIEARLHQLQAAQMVSSN